MCRFGCLLCYYCACNKIISKSATIADEYPTYLTQETALVAQAQTALAGGATGVWRRHAELSVGDATDAPHP